MHIHSKLTVCHRLGANWHDLADYFQIPSHERAALSAGSNLRAYGSGSKPAHASESSRLNFSLQTVQSTACVDRCVDRCLEYAAFARIGQLDLLRQVVGTLYIPDAVYNEMVHPKRERPGAAEITCGVCIH